jgi:hypothetical protein
VAWITSPTVIFTLCFRDDDRAESEHRIHVPLSALALAEAWVLNYASLLTAVSTCALYKIRYTILSKDDGSQVATIGSNAKRRSILIFETEESGQLYVVSIPGLVYAGLMQVGPYAQIQIDPSDTAIAALVNLLINGDGTVRPVAPWNVADGGASKWDWSGVPLVRLKAAYWGYERPGWL